MHEFEVASGNIPEKFKLTCYAKIDKQERDQASCNHTATHILHHILHDFIEQPKQMGSYVDPNKLRFDFECKENLSVEQIKQIEDKVNYFINENHALNVIQTKFEDAVKMGAKAYFKYSENVRVVKFGDSIELCGGTHVENTSYIKTFKIIKFNSVRTGVKRIEAITGNKCIEYLNKNNDILKQVMQIFDADENNLIKKINQKINGNIKTQEEVKKEINIYKILNYNIGIIECTKQAELEKIMQKNNLNLIVEVIKNEAKIQIRMKLDDVMLIKFDARDIIKPICTLIDSKGAGGRKDFVQTGGKQVETQYILKALEEKII